MIRRDPTEAPTVAPLVQHVLDFELRGVNRGHPGRLWLGEKTRREFRGGAAFFGVVGCGTSPENAGLLASDGSTCATAWNHSTEKV